MNLVFHICEDGSEIELKHCMSSKTSVKSSSKYFLRFKNRMRLAFSPSGLESSMERRSRNLRHEFKETTNFLLFSAVSD